MRVRGGRLTSKFRVVQEAIIRLELNVVIVDIIIETRGVGGRSAKDAGYVELVKIHAGDTPGDLELSRQ